MTTGYDQSTPRGFINVSNRGQDVDRHRAAGIQCIPLILMQRLRYPAFKRYSRNQRCANPTGAQRLGHQLFNQRAALGNVGVLLYKQLETSALVHTAIDVLTAGRTLGDTRKPLALRLL